MGGEFQISVPQKKQINNKSRSLAASPERFRMERSLKDRMFKRAPFMKEQDFRAVLRIDDKANQSMKPNFKLIKQDFHILTVGVDHVLGWEDVTNQRPYQASVKCHSLTGKLLKIDS